MNDPQLTFGETGVPQPGPEARPGAARVSKMPGFGAARYHAETLAAYLTNLDRMIGYIQTAEELEKCRGDLLDNCRAALAIVKCMI